MLIGIAWGKKIVKYFGFLRFCGRSLRNKDFYLVVTKTWPNFKGVFYSIKMETSHMNINLEILPFENVFCLHKFLIIMLFNKKCFCLWYSYCEFPKILFTWKFEIFLKFLNVFDKFHKYAKHASLQKFLTIILAKCFCLFLS